MLNHSRKKGIDQVMYLQFQITEFQSNFLILFTNLIPRSFLIWYQVKIFFFFLLVLWTGLWSLYFSSASWQVHDTSTELCWCNFWPQGFAIIKRLHWDVQWFSETCKWYMCDKRNDVKFVFTFHIFLECTVSAYLQCCQLVDLFIKL